jgi:hypothetical protein
MLLIIIIIIIIIINKDRVDYTRITCGRDDKCIQNFGRKL